MVTLCTLSNDSDMQRGMVPGTHWSNYTGTSETLTEIPSEDTGFFGGSQTLVQVVQRAYGVSALGVSKTQWNTALSDLFQLTLL